MLQTTFGDVRDAGRALVTQPRFLAIATLTLALGIGAVTAIFSVVNGVLFRPLPYPHADRLVNVWSTAPGIGYDQFPQSPDLFPRLASASPRAGPTPPPRTRRSPPAWPS